MSEAQTTKKTSKPFCSLAYLAKSTIAINSSNDIRTINGQNSCKNNNNNNSNNNTATNTNNKTSQSLNNNINNNNTNINNGTNSNNNNCQQQPSTPNVAVTAKVNERGSPSLPTGASTTINGHHHTQNANLHNNTTCPDYKHNTNGHSTVADVFGIINEEDMETCCDQVDASLPNDLRRPWEVGTNGGAYCKRIPPSLMTANGYQHLSNGLPSLSKLNSLDCWDYTIELECLKGPQDLQLAAELGKTLLERNKELETLLKEHKNTLEEQEHEIVYLKKHALALREVNDSRLRIYEQLEVGIQDLERQNHRLVIENNAEKKHIKTLSLTVETLEARCEELNKQLEECRQSLTLERRKNERLTAEKNRSGSETNLLELQTTQSKDNNESTSSNATLKSTPEANRTAEEDSADAFASSGTAHNANSTAINGDMEGENTTMPCLDFSMVCDQEGKEEIIKLISELEAIKRAFIAEQLKNKELEEQLVGIIHDNQSLNSRIAQNSANEEMKSMHDELSILDEVRQGQMCSRCLRAMDDRLTINDEQSSLAPTEECEEDEERSLLDLEGGGQRNAVLDDNASENSQAAYHSHMSIKVTPHHLDSLDLSIPGSPNPYRDLVDKYEALLEVQRTSIVRKLNHNGMEAGVNNSEGGAMSLAEELQSSGEFCPRQKLMFPSAGNNNGDNASSCNESMNNDLSQNQAKNNDKNRGRTPTEYSEAETSSSGFSDETSNKSTQTDERPGYFLCSIGDGEDCKFSIYDDVSPIDSRFRNRPEYRELFKEIFAVLKKAAENKEEGDKLPLLDDTHPNGVVLTQQKVPPVTPANEELPVDFADDTQSVISSAVSEQSFAMSECITKLERKTAKKHIIEKNQENKPPMAQSSAQLTSANGKQIVENGRVLTPLKREPLDYLAVGVGIKKKNRRKNRNFSNDRSESSLALPTPPRIFIASGKKRKEVRPYVESPMASGQSEHNTTNTTKGTRSGAKYEWNGSSMIIYNRSLRGRSSNASHDVEVCNVPYRPGTVAKDFDKLKKLDLSYAEVLRRNDECKQHHHNQHQQQQQQRRKNHRH